MSLNSGATDGLILSSDYSLTLNLLDFVEKDEPSASDYYRRNLAATDLSSYRFGVEMPTLRNVSGAKKYRSCCLAFYSLFHRFTFTNPTDVNVGRRELRSASVAAK